MKPEYQGAMRMAVTTLMQHEADELLSMEKFRVDDRRHFFPTKGNSIKIDLQSSDKREDFLLDISNRGIELKKLSLQNRCKIVIPLARLDLGEQTSLVHRNPDGEKIFGPHMHYYKEGYAIKWACSVPLPSEDGRIQFIEKALSFFYDHCKIIEKPFIDHQLW